VSLSDWDTKLDRRTSFISLAGVYGMPSCWRALDSWFLPGVLAVGKCLRLIIGASGSCALAWVQLDSTAGEAAEQTCSAAVPAV
jgi:hypothetical protein